MVLQNLIDQNCKVDTPVTVTLLGIEFQLVIREIDCKPRVCHVETQAFIQAPSPTPNTPNTKNMCGVLAMMNPEILTIEASINTWMIQNMDSVKTPSSDAVAVNMMLQCEYDLPGYRQMVNVVDTEKWFSQFISVLSLEGVRKLPIENKVKLYGSLVRLGNTLIHCDVCDKDPDDEVAISILGNLHAEAYRLYCDGCDSEIQNLLKKVLEIRFHIVITDNKGDLEDCNRRYQLFDVWIKEQPFWEKSGIVDRNWLVFTLSVDGVGTYNKENFDSLQAKNLVLIANPTPILNMVVFNIMAGESTVETVFFQG